LRISRELWQSAIRATDIPHSIRSRNGAPPLGVGELMDFRPVFCAAGARGVDGGRACLFNVTGRSAMSREVFLKQCPLVQNNQARERGGVPSGCNRITTANILISFSITDRLQCGERPTRRRGRGRGNSRGDFANHGTPLNCLLPRWRRADVEGWPRPGCEAAKNP